MSKTGAFDVAVQTNFCLSCPSAITSSEVRESVSRPGHAALSTATLRDGLFYSTKGGEVRCGP